MPRAPVTQPHPIGLRIKEIRAYLGGSRRPWTQEELAPKLGMDDRTLRRREADGELSGDEVKLLAELAQCDTDWILKGQGSPPGKATKAPGSLATARTVREGPPGATPDWSLLLETLNKLSHDVQRETAVRAFRQGLEHQELHGSNLLRAMISICAELERLSFYDAAREIRSEILRATEPPHRKRTSGGHKGPT